MSRRETSSRARRPSRACIPSGPAGRESARAASRYLDRRCPRLSQICSSAAVRGSVAQRLSRLQRELNPLERLALAAQLQKRFALEVEQVLLAHRRLVRKGAAGQDRREGAADDGIVVA